MQPGTLYCGWEPRIVGCQWIRDNSPERISFVDAMQHETLLNCGVVGGDRDAEEGQTGGEIAGPVDGIDHPRERGRPRLAAMLLAVDPVRGVACLHGHADHVLGGEVGARLFAGDVRLGDSAEMLGAAFGPPGQVYEDPAGGGQIAIWFAPGQPHRVARQVRLVNGVLAG